MRSMMGIILAILSIFCFCMPAAADGFLLPEPTSVPIHQAYRVDFHKVDIQIENGVARVEVDQSITNLLGSELEVSYLFPVPTGAVVDHFALIVDGKTIEANLYDRDEARRLYEEIVRQRRDPALLEYAGRGLFRTSIFPLPAHGTRRIVLSYHQVVEQKGDLCRLVYPLATEKYSASPLDRVEIDVDVSATEPINNIYSPSHPLEIVSRTSRRVKARYYAEGLRPETDFVLFFQKASDKDFDITTLTYRPKGVQDGYFLLLASPRADLPAAAVQPKTILFVLDRSGSMNGEKIEQAKEALRTILPNLGSQDRFNIISYNDGVDVFRRGPVAADSGSIKDALDFVDGMTALGSTDIELALRSALEGMGGDNRQSYIVFLTDGQPTAGETDEERIRASISRLNEDLQARLFVFGVGDDVNTILLDGLATDNRGLTTYVRPGQDLEAAVADFYLQISRPVLTDLELTCSGVTLDDCFPRELPDLFYGGQLMVTGRYSGGKRAELTLTGYAGDVKKTYKYSLDFTDGEEDLDRSFVARLWATRKIGYLLDRMRQLDSESGRKELIDEVVRLAKEFGIATEYTSFLVLDEEPMHVAEQLDMAAAAPATGAGAVGSASANKSLQRAEQVQAPQEGWAGDTVKIVADKTFYLRDGVWVDGAYEDGDPAVDITAYTKEYFELADRLGERSAYLSFADEIIVVWEGTAYRITAGED